MLFPALSDADDRLALRFPGHELTYAQLRDAALRVAEQIGCATRVAVWGVNAPETCVAVVGALLAGVPVVPINPKIGERELAHIVADSEPGLVLAEPGADL